MAKDDDKPKSKFKGKGANVVVWLLMAMLVVGLGGFGITNFGGNVTSIGKVGDREIDVNDYARALQQELAALNAQFGQTITLQQAQTFGLDREVRQKLVVAAALDNESARIGVSIGDQRLGEEIIAMKAFQGPTGKFDADTYDMTLQQNKLTKSGFETRVREDAARALLQGAVSGGFTAPAAMVDTLYAYIAERRGFSLLRLTEADLPAPVPAPTEDDLRAYYDANPADFTSPEAKRITYVSLLPEMLAADMPADEQALRDLYQERLSEFVQPERRLVERLVFGSDADAAAAKARLDAGETFDTLVTERGLALSDIDLGDMTQSDLGAAGAAIFALAEPGVVGPLASDLGPALFRMNGILAAQETSFEDARETLVAEQAQDAARRAIDDLIEGLDDKLAGGATLEDLAAESEMQLGTLDFTSTSDEGIAGYADFRTAAQKVTQEDFPQILRLDDGGIFALRLDMIVPPAVIAYDQVADKVAEGAQAEALAKALSDHAVQVKAAIEGGASIGAFGIVDATLQIARDGFVEGAPTTLLPTVFKMAVGDLAVVEAPGFVGLVQLDSIQPASGEGSEAEALKSALASQIEQALAQDALAQYSDALTQEAGISLNDAAINAVHAQFR